MIANSSHFHKMSVLATVLVAGLIVVACVAQQPAPEQVDSSRPTVTYKYHNDEELIQANQRAATFCNRYQSVPRTARFASDPDGSRVVVFECVQPSAPAASTPQINPNLTYDYRTDQELLEASRSAQIYCEKSRLQLVISNIVTNANGTKTITFQCRPQ